jgi:hypothetical protein
VLSLITRWKGTRGLKNFLNVMTKKLNFFNEMNLANPPHKVMFFERDPTSCCTYVPSYCMYCTVPSYSRISHLYYRLEMNGIIMRF